MKRSREDTIVASGARGFDDKTAEKDNWSSVLARDYRLAENVCRILSFNVNGIRARLKGIPPGGLLSALMHLHFTILLAQELKIGRPDARAPLEGASGRNLAALFAPSHLGHHANLMPAVKGLAAWFVKQQPGGSSGITVERCEDDLPVRFSSALPMLDDDAGRARIQTLFVRGPLPVIIVNVYQPNSGDDRKNLPRRLRWDAVFLAYVRELSATGGAGLEWASPVAVGAAKLFGAVPKVNTPSSASAAVDAKPIDCAAYAGNLIVIGDLNVCATDADIFRPSKCHVAGCTEEERGGLRSLLAAADLCDAFRVLHPGDPGFTFVNRTWRGKAGGIAARFDAALVAARLMPRVRSVSVVEDAPRGDHLPLILDIDLTLPESGSASTATSIAGDLGVGPLAAAPARFLSERVIGNIDEVPLCDSGSGVAAAEPELIP